MSKLLIKQWPFESIEIETDAPPEEIFYNRQMIYTRHLTLKDIDNATNAILADKYRDSLSETKTEEEE